MGGERKNKTSGVSEVSYRLLYTVVYVILCDDTVFQRNVAGFYPFYRNLLISYNGRIRCAVGKCLRSLLTLSKSLLCVV